MSGQVNVEVDAAPQEDLNKVLEEVRDHYESVAAKSRKDLDAWFQAKVRMCWWVHHFGPGVQLQTDVVGLYLR